MRLSVSSTLNIFSKMQTDFVPYNVIKHLVQQNLQGKLTDFKILNKKLYLTYLKK